MSSSEENLKPTLNIANYFFEVGLLDDSLTKQLAKQLNEESANNRKKLKRLLSNVNTDILSENKEIFQNFKRNENFSQITESSNSISTNSGNLSLSSYSSVYHSDESIEAQKLKKKEVSDIRIEVPKEKTSNNSINSTPTQKVFSSRRSSTIAHIDTSKIINNVSPRPTSETRKVSIAETSDSISKY